jgi:glycosyltransferase involved in cell wall biosynthesis
LTGWTFEQREQFYRYVLPRATFIVTGNAFGAKQIQEYYNIPTNVIKIIPLPTDPIVNFVANTSVINKYNLRSQNYLFYPAQFWPHKNHISVIDAFCVAKEEFTGFKLVLTGSDKGNLEFIKSYVKELNLSSEVLFLGFVEKDEVNQLYANAFAHIYGSCLGPDNIPPLEAMALDCPTVCANFDGAREQLGDAVLYFDPLDFVQAAKAVKDLKDPELRRLIKVKGRDLIKNLSGVEYCKKINNIINDFVPWRRLWSSGNEYRHL